MEPMDAISKKRQEDWVHSNSSEALLFPEAEDNTAFSDLIVEMNFKLETLTDLCQRLSFSMRELRQVLKIK